MLYSQMLDTVRPIESMWTADVSDQWAQGRTIFGGLQAAIAVRAMRGLIPPSVPLRVLQTSFIAPVPPGPLHIEANVLRTGKSVIHAEARILDRGHTACLVVGTFGQSRHSMIDIQLPKPDAPPPELGSSMPYIEGVLPRFVKHMTMRWSHGVSIFQGAAHPKTQIYVGFRDEPYAGPGALGEGQIIGYADTIPSPGLSLVNQPTNASSLSWTLEMLTDDCGPARDGLWLMDAAVESAQGGYLNQSAVLWSPEGKPVALSRQSVAIFD